MLPAQFTDYHHGGGWFIYQIAALLNLCIYAPFELLGGNQVIDKRVVKEKPQESPPIAARQGVPWWR